MTRRHRFSARTASAAAATTPAFNLEGFPAIRLSSPEENFANQHTVTDTFANTSVPYITQVTKVNGAAAASLALGAELPSPPK